MVYIFIVFKYVKIIIWKEKTNILGIVGLAQFIKIISHYKKIGYNINVLQKTACLVVNPIMVGTLLSS